ncbi:hypothetical protein BDW02DRAFT_573644 [Decorospora gaudefroyi]|uniref:Uncharacterized protein n=1 Tax=Decorospora gaudefroyi TaxID=184978 RepID=A0A6A5K8U1_9PLEO|nr:hypothetical protein BDW02DRAFT_573644 [Decorospora gaudefroyi]
MPVTVDSRHVLVAKGHDEKELKVAKEHDEKELKSLTESTTLAASLERITITRLPTAEEPEAALDSEPRSTLHIYQEGAWHKCIMPTTDPSKERICGPTLKEQKAQRKEKKERINAGLPIVNPDENAFFLHQPYLAFHVPPRVLYMGNSKYNAKPVVLIREGPFWRKYRLQLGPSIGKPEVLDPRGVVSWRHNGGDKKALKADDHKLKGYKVRTWRLWGETGKKFVHTVKANREAGEGPDPDVLEEPGGKPEEPVRAEEVVYLRWTKPLSRHTRRYHFRYAGIDFYWKGTGSVKETRLCGSFLRFNHLKLVARLPHNKEKGKEPTDVCLGTYTSSIAQQKHGKLDFSDAAILRLIEEYAPSLVARNPFEEQTEASETETAKVLRMKKSTMYQVFVATAMCMVTSEKEKRHRLMELLVEAADQGGGGGG